MLKILGRDTSSNVMKVLWACAELGLEFDREDIGGKHGGNNTPDFKKMNPNGLVPVIIDNGFVNWESNSCVRYLAAKHAPGGLYTAAKDRDMDAIEAGRTTLSQKLEIMNDVLAESAFMAGDSFTMGDIPLGIAAWRWFNMPIEREEYPHLKRWVDALSERPGYQKHIMKPVS